MTTQFWIQIVAYAVSLGCLYGALTTRLKVLEKKVDIHNHLVERMYKVEAKLKVMEERVEHE
jgi:hypothetical protein